MKIQATKDLFDYDKENTIWDKIKYKYWDILPYDYRPNQLWYKLKCKLWYRYNIIKVKSLPSTWCDRDYLMLHANFQILTDFIEKEKPYEWFDTEDSHHKQEWIELKELYDWWKKCMNHPDKYRSLLDPDFDEYDNLFDKMAEDEEESPMQFIPDKDEKGKTKFYTLKHYLKDEDKWSDYIRARSNLEMAHEKFLEEKLIKLIKLRKMLWT